MPASAYRDKPDFNYNGIMAKEGPGVCPGEYRPRERVCVGCKAAFMAHSGTQLRCSSCQAARQERLRVKAYERLKVRRKAARRRRI